MNENPCKHGSSPAEYCERCYPPVRDPEGPEAESMVEDPGNVAASEDLSGGPQPNPSAAGREFRGSLPTVQVIPPIAAQLGDIRSLLQGGLDSLKARRHSLGANDIRLLESLARTAKTALELEQAVNASMREKGKLDKLDRAQLEALLGDPRLLRAMLNEEG